MLKKISFIIASVAIVGLLSSEYALTKTDYKREEIQTSTNVTEQKKNNNINNNSNHVNDNKKAETSIKEEKNQKSKLDTNNVTEKTYVYNIADINKQKKTEFITASGILEQVSWGKGHTFFVLDDLKNHEKKIKCVIFAKDATKLGDWVEFIKDNKEKHIQLYVKGFVDEYHGELEIIVKDVYAL